MGKTKLTKISSQSFEHELDRAALEALKKTVGFDRLVRALWALGLDKALNVVNETSNVRLSEKQCPSIWALYKDVCDTLDMDPPPSLYLTNNPYLNAFTFGVDEPYIVVHSALLEGLSDGEIQYVLGHELGHIMAGHVPYRIVAEHMKQILVFLGGMIPGIGILLDIAIVAALLEWSRKAELTADRCGLLAVQEPNLALTGIMRLAAGPGTRIGKELSLEAFMKQARESELHDDIVKKVVRVFIEMRRTHPLTVVRARELDRWVKEGAYEKIVGGDYQRRAHAVIAQGPHPKAGIEGVEGAAAAAEVGILASLARAYGVHVAPRIPESVLHLALAAYAESLTAEERVVAVYDETITGTGEKGVLLTDRRIFSSARPRQGIRYAEIETIESVPGGLFSRPGVKVAADFEVKFHTREMRDAFREAIAAAVEAHGGKAGKAG